MRKLAPMVVQMTSSEGAGKQEGASDSSPRNTEAGTRRRFPEKDGVKNI